MRRASSSSSSFRKPCDGRYWLSKEPANTRWTPTPAGCSRIPLGAGHRQRWADCINRGFRTVLKRLRGIDVIARNVFHLGDGTQSCRCSEFSGSRADWTAGSPRVEPTTRRHRMQLHWSTFRRSRPAPRDSSCGFRPQRAAATPRERRSPYIWSRTGRTSQDRAPV